MVKFPAALPHLSLLPAHNLPDALPLQPRLPEPTPPGWEEKATLPPCGPWWVLFRGVQSPRHGTQVFGVCACVYRYRRSSVLWLSGQALELDYLGSNPDFTTVKG